VVQSKACRSITRLEDLGSIQAFWENAQTHPNADFGQFKVVCQVRSNVISPYVVTLGDPNRPDAALIARLEKGSFSPTIGYFSPIRIPAKVLAVLYQGVLGTTDDSQLEALVQHLWLALQEGRADVVEFNHLSEGSSLLRAFQSSVPQFWTHKNTLWNDHWTLQIPQGEGEFAAKMKPKHRKWLRKKEKELDDAFPGKVAWRWMRHFDDIPHLCASLEGVASRTYQRGLGAGFADDDEHRRRFAVFAERDQLRVQILEIDGENRAFWFGQVYRGVFHSWATGYDPELRVFEPGNLIFHRVVAELAREGVATFDFGLGDALYKRRFGDHSWTEGTVRLFAPTAKGALLKAALGLSTSVDMTARRLLNATGLTERLKTAWRQRIAKKQPGPLA
jgi:hypothetical protein